MTGIKQVAWTVLAAALALMTAQAQAIDDAVKCEADKNKAAGVYAKRGQSLVATYIKKGTPVPPQEQENINAALGRKWQKVEDQAGGTCPTNGDLVPMRTLVSVHVATVGRALAPDVLGGGMPSALPQTGQTQCDQGDGTLGDCSMGSPPEQDGAVLAGMTRSYTDNLDGTITDNVTRLMWEKLSDDGSIHDWDNTYGWYDAFDVKIETLNDTAFAGHGDWRLPNRFELESLVDLGSSSPAIDPASDTSCSEFCTVTTCSCTPESGSFWSSTSLQLSPGDAWFVGFAEGLVGFAGKGDVLSVRAVRPGS